jgi:hypothetical protein
MHGGAGVIREAIQTCNHHPGGVKWLPGLGEEARIRVLDLQEPHRLIVDLRRQSVTGDEYGDICSGKCVWKKRINLVGFC